MYISIYSKNKDFGKRNHITNLSKVSFTLVKRAFDFDTLTADGYTTDDFTEGLIYVINDDNGRPLYSGFCKNAQQETLTSNKRSFKGDDFRKIFDTEILLDFSQNEAQDFTLSGIFRKVANLVTTSSDNDPELNIFNIEVIIPDDTTDTSFIGDYTGQYFIKNAYSFLKVYLAYFEYWIDSHYDVVNDKIVFEFKKSSGEESIKLKDFINTRTTTDIGINKAIATLKVETTDDEGNITPRSLDLPVKYYYLTKDNNIFEGLPESANRVYPVRCKIFENEYLSQAQYDAISALVDARYSEDIKITTDNIYNPLDLSNVELFSYINVYTETGFYKKLPVAEKEIRFTAKNKNSIIKLGFKKTLITEIIKGGNANA